MGRFRASFRRRRPAAEPAPSSEPVYTPVPGGVAICRFCTVLAELFTFVWMDDRSRFNRLFDEGGCFTTLPPVRFTRIEAGETYSAFKQLDPPNDPGPQGCLVVWARNVDMVQVEGSSSPPPA